MIIEKNNPLPIEYWPPLVPTTLKCEFTFTIPFHRLPLLVQVQVIRQTDSNDWINLAMTSKRNERVVKLARIKMKNPCVEICHNPCIKFLPLKLSLLCYDPMYWTNTWKIMTKEDLKPWLNEPNSSMIENAAKLYEKAQNILVFPKRPNISFCTNIGKKATIQELLSNPVMKNWNKLSIYGKKINSEDLKMIMDRATLRRHFESKVNEMPLDFKHKNAFKFASQDYRDARWVQIEDLYGLENSQNVTLVRNNFTQEQIKKFVNHWVYSDVDMFWWMNIRTKDETDFESLVDEYLGLRWSFININLFFMLSKTTSISRKKTMLAISYDNRNDLILTAWADNEAHQAVTDVEELNRPFRNLREKMTKLHKKKELEDLQRVGNENERIELEGKIEDVIAELEELKVVFRNGKAWLMEIQPCKSLSTKESPTPKYEFKLTIPFHRLPLLVQVQVIQTMDPKAWLNLAMTSKRKERMVKMARLNTGHFCVELCHNACIQLPSLKLTLFYDEHYAGTKETRDMMTREDMKSWLNEPSNSMIENAGILYQTLQTIFVIPKALEISYCTDIENEKRATIQELLSNPVMKNWKKLSIYGKTISSEDLKMIMDRATLRRHFELKVEEMPLNFKHENAFKFFFQTYDDARWVKIEDLYRLRKRLYVVLCRTLFTQEQLKSFVNYWVNSHVDMFGWIRIKTAEGLDFENFVDGLLGLQGSDPNSRLFLTLSKSRLNKRKKTMLSIRYDVWEKFLLLKAWDLNTNDTTSRTAKEVKNFENVGKILTLLHKKKELEARLEAATMFRANEEAKMELSEKINESIAELSEFDVIFIDGKVTHELF
ncbi:unnamed protein product [Caenorhabditis brenneri]